LAGRSAKTRGRHCWWQKQHDDQFFKKTTRSSLLGLSLDGNRLEGVVLRRTNGALEVQKTFSASLSLDPLTNDPELVGQEIRNHLEEAGIRERRCAVSVPLSWALTLQTKLPDLPEAEVSSFLQIEAERGFLMARMPS
jgi:Tfp pilus assembly PilM family ATPase